MLILQCVLHWCRAKEKTYTLGSFKRLHKENRFLKVEWDERKKAFDLSFTGVLTEHGTSKLSVLEHLVETAGGIIFRKKKKKMEEENL